MLCSHCGEEVMQDSEVCPACGEPLVKDAPDQPTELATEAVAELVAAEVAEDVEAVETDAAEVEETADVAEDFSESAPDDVVEVVAEVVEEPAAPSPSNADETAADESAEVLDGTAEDRMAVDADEQNATSPLDAVKDAAAPVVGAIKNIDLDWAKESLSAVRERQETLQAISEAASELEDARAELDRLREELAQRLDIAARYDEIQATQGAVVDAAEEKLAKAERQLVAVVADMHEAQKDFDNIKAIHDRLIKPYEQDYDNMREQMRAAEKVLAEAKVVVEQHTVVKEQYLAEIQSNHQQLVAHEKEIDRIAKKGGMTMSEKMRLSNQIAMSMAKLQQRNMELQDLIAAEEKKVAPDLRKVEILTADKEPIELEFQLVTNDLLRQRELFKKQVAPIQAKLDAANARLDAKNQEVQDLRAELQQAEEVVILAQDVHDHPEKTDELRMRIAGQEAIVRKHQEKKSELDSREESLRKADNKGKLLIAGIAGVIVLLALIFAFLG